MVEVLLVMAGGALGAIVRFTLGFVTFKYFGPTKVLTGTTLSNIIGCFLGGVFVSLAYSPGIISSEMALLILIGFLGSVTTFSTFALECVKLISSDTLPRLFAYLFVQCIAALFFTGAGLWIGGVL